MCCFFHFDLIYSNYYDLMGILVFLTKESKVSSLLPFLSKMSSLLSFLKDFGIWHFNASSFPEEMAEAKTHLIDKFSKLH